MPPRVAAPTKAKKRSRPPIDDNDPNELEVVKKLKSLMDVLTPTKAKPPTAKPRTPVPKSKPPTAKPRTPVPKSKPPTAKPRTPVPKSKPPTAKPKLKSPVPKSKPTSPNPKPLAPKLNPHFTRSAVSALDFLEEDISDDDISDGEHWGNKAPEKNSPKKTIQQSDVGPSNEQTADILEPLPPSPLSATSQAQNELSTKKMSTKSKIQKLASTLPQRSTTATSEHCHSVQSIPRPTPPPMDIVDEPEASEDGLADLDTDDEPENDSKMRMIRCGAETVGTDGKINRGGRGVCNGAALAAEVKHLGHRIKLEEGATGTPEYGKHRSLLVGAIGVYVKESLPMTVESFHEYDYEVLKKMIQRFSVHFVITKKYVWLVRFILAIASKRFREWKHYCKKHFTKYGPSLPYEFRNRQNEWEWLCNHFQQPAYKKKCERLGKTRNDFDRVNHCAGRKPFGQIVDEYLNEGNPTPLVATLMQTYAKDEKNGQPIVEKLKKEMNEYLSREYPDDHVVPLLSFNEQCKIIEAARGKKRGTQLVGSEIRKLPLPKISAGTMFTSGLELQEELDNNKQELEKTKAALEKALEEQARERENAAEFRRQMEAQFKALAEHVKFKVPRTSRSSSSDSDSE